MTSEKVETIVFFFVQQQLQQKVREFKNEKNKNKGRANGGNAALRSTKIYFFLYKHLTVKHTCVCACVPST